jgi:CheY-like chemotaxis protein
MIVVVEDQPDQRLALKMALQMEGYSVRVAANGAEAIALISERPPRVLITDIFMPDMDGLELIERVRREFPETKIVALTGGGQHGRVDYLQSSQLLGAQAALQKPFDVKELLALVRKFSQP